MKNVLLFLSCMGVISLQHLNSQCIDFYDGFESGTYTPTWNVGSAPTTWSVTTTAPAAGSYLLEGNGGNSTHLTGLSRTIPAITPTEVSWWMKPAGVSGIAATNYVVLGNSAITATNCIAFCYWQGGNNIRFLGSTSTYVFNCVPDLWYHVEMRNINFVTHTFDIYIDGNLMQTAFPFRNATQNDLSRIHLYNFNAGLGRWDDIRVGASPLDLSTFVTNNVCNGGNTGSVNLTATSTNPGMLTYNWSNAASTEDIGGLAAGSYSVIVTDTLGCVDSLQNILISEPPPIVTSLGSTSVTCNGGADGEASVIASGGTPGYSYFWSNSATTASINGLTAGEYYCSVTDTNNCLVVDTVAVTEPTAINILLSPIDPTTCGGNDGAISSAVSGGTPGYGYSWSNGSTNADISSLTEGSYTLYVLDTAGCIDSSSIVISDPTPTAVSLNIPEDSICINSSLLVLSGESIPGGTYSGPGVSSNNFDPSAAGIGSAAIIYTYTDANNCISTALDQINVISCLGLDSHHSVIVSVYPNPFTDMVQISSSENIQYIEWMDMQGKILNIQTIHANDIITQVNDLPSGIYLLRIVVNGESTIKKLVKS